MINKLFVYGTLLQGETRNHLLDCWKLIDAFEVDGMLYDTSLGYPAADFLDKSSTIFGELYLYDKDNIESILQIIDLEEGADRNLFKRIILESNGTEFFG
ncbi:MAG: gamma-glutamylcyclotransferase, partial [Candidatus Dadabacteria bacterium]|nr:gamma-glutamylcyclotransferase [Candidatus Dadabacteria bacterium]NIS09841.1 gamma-glutamylcyclotransferase [Candidatus Dadabacteria bacterium]NIV41318.1 hypothetical protein [Candidatus Dadabacteria bacterium]NIY22886.1 hypothetical protein [Candidatus Dadabacteria bacterium]